MIYFNTILITSWGIYAAIKKQKFKFIESVKNFV